MAIFRKNLTPDRERELFWRKVKKTDTCWLWTAGKSLGGYGTCTYNNQNESAAHRLAWVFTNGTIPAGKLVCHKCHVRACVNPDHLYIGTHLDNMRDRTKRINDTDSLSPELQKTKLFFEKLVSRK